MIFKNKLNYEIKKLFATFSLHKRAASYHSISLEWFIQHVRFSPKAKSPRKWNTDETTCLRSFLFVSLRSFVEAYECVLAIREVSQRNNPQILSGMSTYTRMWLRFTARMVGRWWKCIRISIPRERKSIGKHRNSLNFPNIFLNNHAHIDTRHRPRM